MFSLEPRTRVSHSLKAAGASDVGRVRRRNEDAFHVDPRLGLIAVADGMGGHPAGDVASSLAVTELTALLREPPTPDGAGTDDSMESDALGGRMAEAVRRANARILDEADADPLRAGMGTTLTALQVSAATGGFTLGHVGDSRGYVFSQGRLRRLTRDHTWVQEMIDAGKLSADVGEGHPLRHILSRALGIGPAILPEVTHGQGQPGDLFLLCTDGLAGMIPDAELEAYLLRNGTEDLNQLARGLVQLANDRGGSDNITVVLLRLDE